MTILSQVCTTYGELEDFVRSWGPYVREEYDPSGDEERRMRGQTIFVEYLAGSEQVRVHLWLRD
jgi:hypothetical protein